MLEMELPISQAVTTSLNCEFARAQNTEMGYGLDDRGSRVRFPAQAGNFSLCHCVQNGSGAHPASYPMGNCGSFSGGKAAGAWSWPLTFIYRRGQRLSRAIHSPNTPSWRGAQLKRRNAEVNRFRPNMLLPNDPESLTRDGFSNECYVLSRRSRVLFTSERKCGGYCWCWWPPWEHVVPRLLSFVHVCLDQLLMEMSTGAPVSSRKGARIWSSTGWLANIATLHGVL
jgi:hypothetical protein